jgi:hypothetical protein
MARVYTEIQIAATPEQVRAVVSPQHPFHTNILTNLPLFEILDFPSYNKWQTFIQSITHISSSPSSPPKDPYALVPGDKLAVNVSSTELSPAVVSNTSNEFSWYGSMMGGALAGRHYFEFRESEDGKGTVFVHGEDYDGWMTWMFGEGWGGVMRRTVVGLYRGFCEDVGRRVEELNRRDAGIKET